MTGKDQNQVDQDSPLSSRAEASEHLRLANILDQMPVGIGIFDSGGSLFHANRHFESAAGGEFPTLHAMRGEFWRGIASDGTEVEENDYPPFLALEGRVDTKRMDFVRCTDDGHEHWIAVSAVPLTGPQAANVVGVVVVVEEADSERRHARELRARDERFMRFARHSSNVLWIADLNTGNLEHLSLAVAKILPHHQQVDTLAKWNRIIHPADLPSVLHYRANLSDSDIQRVEYRLIDERGEVARHVRETSFPIPDDRGQPECIGSIIEDISPEVQIYLVQLTGQRSDLIEELRHSPRRIKRFSSAEDFMNVADVLNPGCVVIDLRDTGADTPQIERILASRPKDLQIVFVGEGETTDEAVSGIIRAGAVDYLVEPLAKGVLSSAVQKAVDALPSKSEADDQGGRLALAQRIAALPRREREVLQGLVAGGTNKIIARTLGISPRTIEVHRAHLMERLNVRTLSELIALAHEAGIAGSRR